MSSGKEVVIFTKGDANNAKTWSNIPYFLVSTLKSKGYLVNLVNVESTSLWEKIYDKFFCRLLRKLLMRQTTFTYERSLRYSKEVHARIKKAVAEYPNSQWYLSTSFSYSPSDFTQKPCILLCDWTYDYYLHHFKKKEPDRLEKKEILRQNEVIEKADYVFSLFPDITEYMCKYYKNPNIFYLGNVINSDFMEYESDTLIKRMESPHVLFIGLPKYLSGAKSLISAIQKVRQSGFMVELDIIGMHNSDISESLPSFVHCYGYLEKSNPKERVLYDSLLSHALVYVNTTPVWAGFSSALESMYHYIPIIITPYTSFTDTFGRHIDFGYYCNENKTSEIAFHLSKFNTMSTEDYLDICQNARNAANPFTWSSYVDKMLNKIDNNISC